MFAGLLSVFWANQILQAAEKIKPETLGVTWPH